MIIDLHLHTSRHSSCSIMSPEELVKTAVLRGLDGIAITEHHYKWPEFEIKKLIDKLGTPELLILSGQEIRAYHEGFPVGDILSFGFYGNLEGKKLTASQIIQFIHDEGGIAIAAHPYRDILGFGDAVYYLDFDAIEVYNSNHTKEDVQRSYEASHKLGLPAVAGSDAHSPDIVGMYFTDFCDVIENERDLILAIKAGRCVPCGFETRS